MTKPTRRTFSELKPGDVLMNCQDQNDTFVVVRVGDRLDFFHLIDGRYLEAQVGAHVRIHDVYDVLRDGRLVFFNELGYKSNVMLFA